MGSFFSNTLPRLDDTEKVNSVALDGKETSGNSKQIYPEVPLREEMLIGMEREEIDLCETTAPFTFFVSS